jgi:hypothetical protein
MNGTGNQLSEFFSQKSESKTFNNFFPDVKKNRFDQINSKKNRNLSKANRKSVKHERFLNRMRFDGTIFGNRKAILAPVA